MYTQGTIVVATPHSRNDELVGNLRRRLSTYRVVRIVSQDELSQECLEQLRPSYVFFPHWSWIIPSEIYNRFECVIFHMTDLPYGRGGSPLQNLIVRGHKHTKLSAIKCVTELDAGPVYTKASLSLNGTAEEILLRASGLIEEMIVKIIRDRPMPEPQIGDVVVFKRRHPEDGDISDLEDVGQVYDYIRMLDAEGYQPAFVKTKHLVFEFSQACIDRDEVVAEVRIRRRHDGLYEE